jgi:hypothetical protein
MLFIAPGSIVDCIDLHREISSVATIPGTRHMMGGYRFGSGGQKMWFALAAVTFATARGFNVLALALQDREH